MEPAASAVLSGGPAGPHMIEGIGPGFRAAVLDMDMVDEVRRVSDDDAFKFTARLAAEEGLKTSASSGAALCAACNLAREMGPGKNIVVILPGGA